MGTKTIDATPSWEATALMLCGILENGDDKAWARSELARMGRIIDARDAGNYTAGGALKLRFTEAKSEVKSMEDSQQRRAKNGQSFPFHTERFITVSLNREGEGNLKYSWAIVKKDDDLGCWYADDINGVYHCGEGDSGEECKADASIQITGNMDAVDNIYIV